MLLRRDHPDLEQHDDGAYREVSKYLSPPGRGNLLYFPPGTAPAWLLDASMPVILTEGEKKALALSAPAWHGQSEAVEEPRWLAIGIPGARNFRGVLGKTGGPNGARLDVPPRTDKGGCLYPPFVRMSAKEEEK